MNFALLPTFLFGFRWRVTYVNGKSKPRELWGPECTMNDMWLVKFRAIEFRLVSHPSLSWTTTENHWYLSINESNSFSFRIIDIYHASILVENESPIWVIIIVKCWVLHVSLKIVNLFSVSEQTLGWWWLFLARTYAIRGYAILHVEQVASTHGW